jgi:hypothetical protein
MITFIIKWGNPRQIQTGEYQETFTNEDKAREVKRKKDERHPGRVEAEARQDAANV